MHRRNTDIVSLAGEWRFALDPDRVGIKKGFPAIDFSDTIKLPGTTDEGKKGAYNAVVELRHLTREYPYVGLAWYQRSIEIRAEWVAKHVRLLMERTKNSTLWLDGSCIGKHESLCTPHVYELGTLAPGTHRITLGIDNSVVPPVGGCHQLSDETQTNWNGIVGRIELQMLDHIWIDDIQVYPDVQQRLVRLEMTVQNLCGSAADGCITVWTQSTGTTENDPAAPESLPVSIPVGVSLFTLDYSMNDAALWDDLSPHLYKLEATLVAQTDKQRYHDHVELSFGMREFAAKGTQFTINDRRVFLRGKNDACVFPLTGYAPMEVDQWVKVFHTAKSYGINHYRFHTWCPPEAAFAAADFVGMYLQPELPNWRSLLDPGDPNCDTKQAEFLRGEGRRILRTFGNHPSFVMFTLGNELFGSRSVMADMVDELRQLDNRHLYAQGTNNFYSHTSLAAGDDFWVTMRTTGLKAAVRGAFSHADPPLGHIQTNPPSTRANYVDSIRNVPIPVISHEVGQYQAYPNLDEIPKYTGVLKPRNLIACQKLLRDKGLLDQAKDFYQASGKLMALCYREEIETAFRTPGFGGFQLLDLQDFPGQGTALVGILDAFMEAKGFITPDQWREFCADTVLLALMDKYTYRADELFRADIEVAHYGRRDMDKAVVQWSFSNESGDMLMAGELAPFTIKAGQLTKIGSIGQTLVGIEPPARLNLELKIKDASIVNHYPIWLYPAKPHDVTSPRAAICRNLADALGMLKAGRNCLLIPYPEALAQAIDGDFASDFWCYPTFKSICDKMQVKAAPGTLGILCDPKHPALRHFPTEGHSNWQWWHILKHSKSVILDSLPKSYRPIVQVIDNCDRNHKLGLVFEAKVGDGKLLVCTSDLLAILDRPEAAQLLLSLSAYMASADFAPAVALDESTLAIILR